MQMHPSQSTWLLLDEDGALELLLDELLDEYELDELLLLLLLDEGGTPELLVLLDEGGTPELLQELDELGGQETVSCGGPIGQVIGTQISWVTVCRQPLSSYHMPVITVKHWQSGGWPLELEGGTLDELGPLLDDEEELLEELELLDELDEELELLLDDEELLVWQQPSPQYKSSHRRLSAIHLAQPNVPAVRPPSGTMPSESTTVIVSSPLHQLEFS